MKVGIIQMTSVLEPEVNFSKIEKFIVEAIAHGVSHLYLPECFVSMSDGVTPTPHTVEEGNPLFKKISAMAKTYGIFLLSGTAATRNPNGKAFNRAYNFDSNGEDLGHYDKRFLFSCDIQGKKRKQIDEADIYQAGLEAKVIEADDWKIGLGVCFDLRFSQTALEYRNQGAEILTYSSAFTVPTGKAHWHILCQARAIESQCYVIAPAQWGRHNDRIQTFGHSLIIDPWGEILADGGEGEKLIFADIDKAKIAEIRSKVLMGI